MRLGMRWAPAFPPALLGHRAAVVTAHCSHTEVAQCEVGAEPSLAGFRAADSWAGLRLSGFNIRRPQRLGGGLWGRSCMKTSLVAGHSCPSPQAAVALLAPGLALPVVSWTRLLRTLAAAGVPSGHFPSSA